MKTKGTSLSLWKRWSLLDRCAVLVIIAGAAVEIVFFLFVPPGGDAGIHVFRMGAWHELWQHGVFFVRWLPQALEGYGSPAFYFYPPSVYLLSSVLYSILPHLTSETIFRCTSTLFDIGSFVLFSWYLRSRGFSRWSAWLAALLYAFAPYRFLDAEVRGAIAEHASFMFLPVLLWGLDRILFDRDARNTAVLAFACGWSAIIWTNIPATGVVFCGIIIYSAAQYKQMERSQWMRLLAGLMLGIGLAAPVLLPAYSFGSYLLPEMLAQSDHSFGNSNTPLLDIFAGKNLTVNAYCLVTLVGALALWSRSNTYRQDRSLRALLVAVLLVQLPFLSGLLFQYFPPAVLIQFPWRFDLLLVPIVALLWARHLEGERNRSSPVVLVWIAALFVLIGTREAGIAINSHSAQTGMASWEAMVPRWSPNPNDPTTAFWTSDSPANVQIADALTPSETMQPITHTFLSDSVRVRFERAHVLVFHRFYWPTWHAQIDGNVVDCDRDTNGRLIIPVAAGIHSVSLSLGTSWSERAGNWIALLSALILLLSLVSKHSFPF
ncbi:MAG TPA: hypothetical protein VGM92_15430, partial [Candidatus Kapabacteria bacterium]